MFKRHLLFLIAVSLTSCSGLKKFPTKYIYEIDLDHKVCGKYEIVDPEQFSFKHVADLPLNSCNGVFGFSTDSVGLVLDWSKDAIQKFNQKCQ